MAEPLSSIAALLELIAFDKKRALESLESLAHRTRSLLDTAEAIIKELEKS
jgi:hypothetical protein